MARERPAPLTVIALLLAWLSLGGFTIAIWASTIDVRFGAQVALVVVGLWYGVSALGAALGLWRMRSWALPLVASWGGATLAAGWLPQFLTRNQPPLSTGIGATALLLLVVLPVWFYVRRRLRRPEPG
jgi:hypothetical protein